MPQTTVAALYKFVALPDYEQLRNKLLAQCEALDIKGSLLLAAEGINGTIAGSAEAIAEFKRFLLADQRFNGLEYKESQHDQPPFLRLKVKLKQEIVTMGVPDTDPESLRGTYVNADEWNALVDDPETLVIDTRNDYEIAIGQFQNAVSPDTRHFREFPEYVNEQLDPSKHKKIAMYCTGGIRCEKASHFLLKQGFPEVYHLKGGILQYLEDVAPEQNRWEGECFVFDERVAVDKDLRQGSYSSCGGCGGPVSAEDKNSEHFEIDVSCPACAPTLTDKQRSKRLERSRQKAFAKAKGFSHLGPQTRNKK